MRSLPAEVTLERLPDRGLPRPYGRFGQKMLTPSAYQVRLNDEPVGEVWRDLRSWERKPKGARYVTARGSTPCWKFERGGYGYDTRTDAVLALLHRLERA